jgi:hypothetical protein
LVCFVTNQVKKQRISHFACGYLLDVLWNSRTENHALGLWHKVLENFDVPIETHIKHFVAFVQNLVQAV